MALLTCLVHSGDGLANEVRVFGVGDELGHERGRRPVPGVCSPFSPLALIKPLQGARDRADPPQGVGAFRRSREAAHSMCPRARE